MFHFFNIIYLKDYKFIIIKIMFNFLCIDIRIIDIYAMKNSEFESEMVLYNKRNFTYNSPFLLYWVGN